MNGITFIPIVKSYVRSWNIVNPLERNLMVTGSVIAVLGIVIPAIASIVQSIGPDLIKAVDRKSVV